MATLQESVNLLGEVRRKNPGLDSLNDQELADLLYRDSGDERLQPARQSSALMRGVNKVGTAFGEAGASLEGLIADEQSSFPVKVLGRAANNLVSSAPELAINLAAGATKGIPRLLGYGLGSAFSYGRTKAETGSDTAALGSAAGSLASLAGGIAGAQAGRKLAGPNAGKIGGFLAGAAGSTAGSIPGDVLEIATSPGGLSEFLDDPLNVPAYLVGEAVVGGGLDLATQAAERRAVKKETTRNNIEDFDNLINRTEMERISFLRSKPAAEKTELDIEEQRRLEARANAREELHFRQRRAAERPAEDFATFPETPATLRAQLYLVHAGKKAVMEIPRGTSFDPDKLGFAAYREHESPTNGHLYLYNETKTSPEMIENAIKTDSLGLLLGYGTPAKPKAHNGTAAVLRNKYGTEKAAVILGDGNENSVMKALGEMALGGDKVTVEKLPDVIKSRARNKGLIKMHSIAGEDPNPASEISFTTHVLDMLGKSFEPSGKKGPKFQLDERQEISSAGLLQAVKKWAPPSLWEHYRERGIETLFNPNKVEPVVMYTIFGKEQYGRQFQQVDLLVNEGRGEPLSKEELAKYPQAPEGMATGQYVYTGKGFDKIDPGTDYDAVKKKYLRTPGKVRASEFIDWLRQNTPEVEVKELVPYNQADESAQLEHELETLGWTPIYDDNGNIESYAGRDGHHRDYESLPSQARDVADSLRYVLMADPHSDGLAGDAATGRYGIEPKTLENMPGAVDILVRVPLKDQPGNEFKDRTGRTVVGKEKPLFEADHFEQSDKNVLASIRGYEETLPSGEKVFHIFELQSDWGQRLRKDLELLKNPKVTQGRDVNQLRRDFYNTPDHPLVKHYETLALKTAIQHARSIGAKYIAISDGETAMMTEGHDRLTTWQEQAVQEFGSKTAAEASAARYREDGDFEYEVRQAGRDRYTVYRKAKVVRPSQEPGMRAAYDGRLPAIAARLTRSKPFHADFGMHKRVNVDEALNDPTLSREENIKRGAYKGSPIFNNKTNITARVYDITNPSPEIRRLFSLYDAEAQANFEHTLSLEQKRIGEVITPKEVLERALSGEYTDARPLLNFLNSIKGIRGALREGTFLSPNKLAEFDIATRDVTLNKDLSLRVNEALRTLGHEFTHGALFDLKRKDPQTYEYVLSLVDEIGVEGRASLLADLGKRLNMGQRFDSEYLSGKRFQPNDPHLRERQAHEFIAALTEVSAQHFVNSTSTPDWYRYLPKPIVDLLQAVARTFKKYFGPDYPGVGHMLNPAQAHRLQGIVKTMDDAVSSTVSQNLRELLKIQKSSVFDETRFVDSLPTFKTDMAKSLSNLKGGDGVMHSWAGDMFKKAVGLTQSKYEKYFYSALFRVRDRPETADHFYNLHQLRPSIQTEIYSALATIGQQADGSLSRQQAIERYGKFVSEVTNPSNKRGQRWLDVTSQILEENTNRRQALMEKKAPVTRQDLVSLAEMQEKYGLTAEEAEFVDRFSRVPEIVMKDRLIKQEQSDSYRIAKLFYRANKRQDMHQVVSKVERLNRIANDFGAKRYELDTFKKVVEAEERQAQPNPEVIARYQADINRLSQEAEAFKLLFEQAIRDEFAGSIPLREGQDGFVSASAEIMVRMAAQREQQRIITQNIGYAPMTRRGRFNLRVYEENEFSEDHAQVKEFRGFETRKEAEKYIADNKITKFDLIDKEELRDRVRLFTPDRIRRVRDKAKQDLQELILRVSRETETMDFDQRTFLLDFLNENIEARFQPLEEEYKDVVAIKGDKFKERRYLVPGFDRNDFLPNIVEYLDFNTVAGNKMLTRAKGDYFLENAKLDSDPELRLRMEDELGYTLSNQEEWNTLRKSIFYFYLGGSIRHIAQNAAQIPLNGISQMVAEGYGFGSYKHFAQAAKLAMQWNLKGSTGDKVIDSLLKQAEKDGVSVQHALENPVHESVELQNALDSINAQSSGSKLFGKRISHAGTRLVKGFERFMQSTSAAAESANRKTSFIASVLAQRSKGVKDIREQYAQASKFTNFVNFVGDKPNRPGYIIKSGGHWSHGPLVAVSALQSFTLNHVSQLYSFWKKGFQQGSKADKQAFYTGIAHLLAFSGSMGFVGAATAEALFEEVTGISLKTALREGLVVGLTSLVGDDDKETMANAADRVSDTVLMGLPGLVGLDLSGSIGLGSPLVRYQAGQPITAEQLAGPGAGMIGRVGQAVGDISADPFNPQQWWAATRSAAPTFLSQLLRVYDVLSAGTVIDKNQQPVGDPLGIAASAGVVAGFNPAEVSKQRQLNSEIYKAAKRDSEDYELKVRNISALLHEFNQTGDPDALLRANNQFSAYLDSVGGLQDRSSMIDSITDQLEQFEGRVTRPASLKASPGRQRLERAFPSLKSRAPTKQSSLLKSLEVASFLGQDDLLYQKLQSLPSSLLDSVLNDALVQAGLRPEVAGLVQRPGTLGRLGPNLNLSALSGR